MARVGVGDISLIENGVGGGVGDSETGSVSLTASPGESVLEFEPGEHALVTAPRIAKERNNGTILTVRDLMINDFSSRLALDSHDYKSNHPVPTGVNELGNAPVSHHFPKHSSRRSIS